MNTQNIRNFASSNITAGVDAAKSAASTVRETASTAYTTVRDAAHTDTARNVAGHGLKALALGVLLTPAVGAAYAGAVAAYKATNAVTGS